MGVGQLGGREDQEAVGAKEIYRLAFRERRGLAWDNFVRGI